MNYNMHKLERHQILGGDGKTMVWVYDGDVEYRPTKNSANFSYFTRADGERRRTRNGAQYEAMFARTNSSRKYVKNQPTYNGVEHSEEFSTFDKWVEHMENRVGYMCVDDNDRLWQLDKDLLGNGKLYSPENVCFLPASINSRLSSFDNFSFDAKKSFFGDIYENYFDVFEDEVLEAFFEMSKFDFGLDKEQRLTLEQKLELENKEKEISEIRNDISALHIWEDINNPRQSVKFLNGWYYIDLTRKGQKVIREKFSCVYDAVLRKIDLKIDILNDLNAKYRENDLWYSEGFDKIHFDKLVMLSELKYLIKSGELVIPQWIEVNKAYKGG